MNSGDAEQFAEDVCCLSAKLMSAIRAGKAVVELDAKEREVLAWVIGCAEAVVLDRAAAIRRKASRDPPKECRGILRAGRGDEQLGLNPADVLIDAALGVRFDCAGGYWGSLSIAQARALAQRIMDTWPGEKAI